VRQKEPKIVISIDKVTIYFVALKGKKKGREMVKATNRRERKKYNYATKDLCKLFS